MKLLAVLAGLGARAGLGAGAALAEVRLGSRAFDRGLGLALVERIVEASGGDVRYEHEHETRFVLSFPTVTPMRSHRIVQPPGVNTPRRVEVHT